MSFERRKVRVGRVVSDKMDKTVTVVVEWRRPHRLYKKAVRRRTRFKVHDAENRCRVGDLVRIIETRPIARTKRWRVADILASLEIAEIQPVEIVDVQPDAIAPEPVAATQEGQQAPDLETPADAQPVTEDATEVTPAEADVDATPVAEDATPVEQEPSAEADSAPADEGVEDTALSTPDKQEEEEEKPER